MINIPHWNQVNFDHPHKNQINFDAHTETKRLAARIQKLSQFQHPAIKSSQSITAVIQVNFKLISAAHSQFRTPAQKHVNFDPNTKTKSNSIGPTKIKLISTPLKSSQFDPHSKTKSISMPRHKNQVNFDPDTKT